MALLLSILRSDTFSVRMLQWTKLTACDSRHYQFQDGACCLDITALPPLLQKNMHVTLVTTET